MKKKILNIIIPILNSVEVLDIPLSSIIKQKKHNFELKILLVDSDSSDGIKDFVKKYKTILDIQIYNAGPCSIGQARNIGINNSNCDYVIFLDSDDALTTNRLYTDSNLIENNYLKKEIDFIFGNSIQIVRKNFKYSYENIVHKNPKFLQYLHMPYNLGSLTINLKNLKTRNISFEDGRLGEDWKFTIDLSNKLSNSFFIDKPRIIINSRIGSHTQDKIQYQLSKNTFKFLNYSFKKYDDDTFFDYIINLASINCYLFFVFYKFLKFSSSKNPNIFVKEILIDNFQRKKLLLLSIFLLPISFILQLFFHRKSKFSCFKKDIDKETFLLSCELLSTKI